MRPTAARRAISAGLGILALLLGSLALAITAECAHCVSHPAAPGLEGMPAGMHGGMQDHGMSTISEIASLGTLSISPRVDASCCSPAGCAGTSAATGSPPELLGIASSSQIVSVGGALGFDRLRAPHRTRPDGPKPPVPYRVEGAPLYLVIASFLL